MFERVQGANWIPAPVAELFYDTGYPEYVVLLFFLCVPLLHENLADLGCKSDIGIELWQLLPFSRGNVKITVRKLLPFNLQASSSIFFSSFPSRAQTHTHRRSRRSTTFLCHSTCQCRSRAHVCRGAFSRQHRFRYCLWARRDLERPLFLITGTEGATLIGGIGSRGISGL